MHYVRVRVSGIDSRHSPLSNQSARPVSAAKPRTAAVSLVPAVRKRAVWSWATVTHAENGVNLRLGM